MNNPDNEQYWIDRHKKLQGSLASVGKIGTPEKENRQRYARKKRRIVDVLRRVNGIDLLGKSVLDAGCGIGLVSEIFMTLGAEVSGVDASKIAIEEAMDRAAPPNSGAGRFIEGSLVDFKFDKEFDIVCCFDVLYHIIDDNNWRLVIHNFRRHMAKGGFIFIIDKLVPEPQSNGPHVRFRTKQMYDKVFDEIGLRPVELNMDRILIYR